MTLYKQNKICADFILQVNKRTRLVANISKFEQQIISEVSDR